MSSCGHQNPDRLRFIQLVKQRDTRRFEFQDGHVYIFGDVEDEEIIDIENHYFWCLDCNSPVSTKELQQVGYDLDDNWEVV